MTILEEAALLIRDAEARAKAYADEQCTKAEARLNEKIALLERVAALDKRVAELERRG